MKYEEVKKEGMNTAGHCRCVLKCTIFGSFLQEEEINSHETIMK